MSYRIPDSSGRCVGQHRQDPERPRMALTGAHLCAGCSYRLQRALEDIPALVDDLERALLNGSTGQGAKVSGSPTRPLPYNDDASEARRVLLTVLRNWTNDIALDRGDNWPSDPSPRGQAEWQRNRLHVWTVSQDWIAEYATNVQEAVSEGRRVLAGSRTRLLPLGRCNGHTACDVATRYHYPCPGEIRARVDLIDELLPAAVACTDCGQVHTARELPALGKALTGGVSWVTSAQAAGMVGVAESRIRAIALGNDDPDKGEPYPPWRRRDAEGIRPSRWNLDDVEQTIKRRNAQKTENAS